MGQALDRDGKVLAEAFGETKREVFDKLMAAKPDAHEIRIRSNLPPENSQGDMTEPPVQHDSPQSDGDSASTELKQEATEETPTTE